ncbi:MAG: ABC-F family ATP-binding cassette domain-containing protein [Legionellales bacterium]|nr:ABC-F family ATP-binding cassette domain-containing protein [Legionellales bacterium]
MITLNQLSITFGQKLLFYDVNLILNSNKAYALVGANGCGKSTLFKLMTGEEEASSGEVIKPKDASIGWLKQDQFRYEDTLIRDIVLEGRAQLAAVMQEKDALLLVDDWSDAQGMRFAELEHLIYQEGGYAAPSQIETILLGLGIPLNYHDQPLRALSGGYKLRVLLAQVLFQNPSILLLDELTNHLDIESIRWLEHFLATEYTGLLIFISHDMDFINHLADAILDVDFGEIRQYPGNYAKFLTEKALLQTQKMVERQKAEDQLAHMQKFVDRFKAKASKAAQARSRIKMMEKIELPDILKSSRIAPVFHLVPKKPSVKLVCTVDNLSKSFEDRVLFQGLRFIVNRHDKIAIVGANGRGKSTLLKLMQSFLPPDQGQVIWGPEVRVSYFSQDHHDLLHESQTVLSWLSSEVQQVTEQQIRKTLGQMLLTKEEVDKNILALSGGEAARLLMAKVILEAPNVLILDEPTNHMDLETIESLADALAAFTGTLLVVSHNRHFIEKFATRILYFPPTGKIQDFKGGYGEFLEATEAMQ